MWYTSILYQQVPIQRLLASVPACEAVTLKYWVASNWYKAEFSAGTMQYMLLDITLASTCKYSEQNNNDLTLPISYQI